VAVADLSDLKPVYLIHGTEDLLLERAVRRLRGRLADVADLDFNLEVFDGQSARAEDAVNAANTMPFMSEKRLVIVNDIDKMDAADVAALASYALDPAPYTCLVLTAQKVNRGSKLYKAVNALGGAYEYTAPKRYEYAARVAEFFREHGKSISQDAAQAMVDAVGRDLRRLDTETDKVVAYVGDRQKVTVADIVDAVSAGAPTSIFDFLDAVGRKDRPAALRLLSGLLAGGGMAPLGVHAMAVRHVRALTGARALMDRGVRIDQMAPELGMAPWQVKNVVEQARSFEPAELRRALCGLAAAEATMKTSPATDAGLVLERWVVEVTGR
jgi:DNA polymerase-3 subunit delta